jgi:hypothetical protein
MPARRSKARTRPEAPAARGVSKPRQAPRTRWLRQAFAEAPETVEHTAGLVLALISIWVIHKVFVLLLEPEATFYDSIPIKWAFDTAHIAVLTRFVWKLVRRIWTS